MDVISSNARRQLTSMYADLEMSLKWYFGTSKTLRKATVLVQEENINNKSHCSGISGTMSY